MGSWRRSCGRRDDRATRTTRAPRQRTKWDALASSWGGPLGGNALGGHDPQPGKRSNQIGAAHRYSATLVMGRRMLPPCTYSVAFDRPAGGMMPSPASDCPSPTNQGGANKTPFARRATFGARRGWREGRQAIKRASLGPVSLQANLRLPRSAAIGDIPPPSSTKPRSVCGERRLGARLGDVLRCGWSVYSVSQACSDVTSAVVARFAVVRAMRLGRHGGCVRTTVVHNNMRLVYADHVATPDTPRHIGIHRRTMPPANRGCNRGRLQTSQANYLRDARGCSRPAAPHPHWTPGQRGGPLCRSRSK
jgi:hypothetical protein